MRGPIVPVRYRKHKLKAEIVGGLNEEFIFATKSTEEDKLMRAHQAGRIRVPAGFEWSIHSIASGQCAAGHLDLHHYE